MKKVLETVLSVFFVFAFTAAEAGAVDLAQVEDFTDEINELTRVIEEQRLERTKLENELQTLEAEAASDLLSSGEKNENRRGQEILSRKLHELNEEFARNEARLETYSERIQEANGFAPELFADSAISVIEGASGKELDEREV